MLFETVIKFQDETTFSKTHNNRQSKNQNENFLTKGLFSKKFSFWFFDCHYKTTENLANHGNKS